MTETIQGRKTAQKTVTNFRLELTAGRKSRWVTFGLQLSRLLLVMWPLLWKHYHNFLRRRKMFSSARDDGGKSCLTLGSMGHASTYFKRQTKKDNLNNVYQYHIRSLGWCAGTRIKLVIFPITVHGPAWVGLRYVSRPAMLIFRSRVNVIWVSWTSNNDHFHCKAMFATIAPRV